MFFAREIYIFHIIQSHYTLRWKSRTPSNVFFEQKSTSRSFSLFRACDCFTSKNRIGFQSTRRLCRGRQWRIGRANDNFISWFLAFLHWIGRFHKINKRASRNAYAMLRRNCFQFLLCTRIRWRPNVYFYRPAVFISAIFILKLREQSSSRRLLL